MSLYVLDTDHLSLYRYGHPEVSAHIEATPADQLAVTIITIEEQTSGLVHAGASSPGQGPFGARLSRLI